MGKTSKKERIHPGWNILGVVRKSGSDFFEYQCTRCKVKVLNGQPFSEAKAEECK